MGRQFGIEIETCVVLSFNFRYGWLEYVCEYLSKVRDNMLLNNSLILYSKSFEI